MSAVLENINDDIISEQVSPVIRGDDDVDVLLYQLRDNESAIVQHVSTGNDLIKEQRRVIVKIQIWIAICWLYNLVIALLAKGNFKAQAAAFILKQGCSLSRQKVHEDRLVTIKDLRAFHTSQISICCKRAVDIKENIHTLINHGHATKTETARKILDHMF